MEGFVKEVSGRGKRKKKNGDSDLRGMQKDEE